MKLTNKELDLKLETFFKESKKKQHLVFSMQEYLEKDKNDDYESSLVEVPFNDFLEDFCQGKVIFAVGYGNKLDKSKVIENPSWGETLLIANKFARGDHRFLESIDFQEEKDGVKHYSMFFGS